jgi:Protein of unknown function (DUF2568)
MTARSPRSSSRRVGPGATLVLGLRFVTEMALVGGAAWAASTRPGNVLVAVGAGILAALAVAAVWGVAIAPNSRRRLADPLRLALEIALFGAVAAGLAAVDHVPAAVALAVVGSATAVAVRFVGPGERTHDTTKDDAPTDGSPAASAAPELRRPRGPGRARRSR